MCNIDVGKAGTISNMIKNISQHSVATWSVVRHLTILLPRDLC